MKKKMFTTRKERAAFVEEVLNSYFPDPPIPLNHTSVYTLLIAVLLSARSTDAMVNRITPKLFEKASTPQEMILLSQDELRALIKPCGLSPQKSKAILGLSFLLLEKHGGSVPKTFRSLEALPGIGHKSASVIMSQAFNKPAFPVDTHIFRCAKRWGLSEGKTVTQVERDLKKIFPNRKWNRLHLQIIYYARRFCPSRGHKVEKCPICRALKS